MVVPKVELGMQINQQVLCKLSGSLDEEGLKDSQMLQRNEGDRRLSPDTSLGRKNGRGL